MFQQPDSPNSEGRNIPTDQSSVRSIDEVGTDDDSFVDKILESVGPETSSELPNHFQCGSSNTSAPGENESGLLFSGKDSSGLPGTSVQDSTEYEGLDSDGENLSGASDDEDIVTSQDYRWISVFIAFNICIHFGASYIHLLLFQIFNNLQADS